MLYLSFLGEEIGLFTLVGAGFDVHAIIALRMLRLIIFGATSLIIVTYLKMIAFDESQIGLIMSGIFAGDLLTSFLWSMAADQWGRQRVLVISSFTLLITCLTFTFCTSPRVLLAVAFIGVITPSGGEVGPFRSVELSSLALLVPHSRRLDIYAWYAFLGLFCGAVGNMVAGHVVDFALDRGCLELMAYQAVFLLTAMLSAIMVIFGLLMSDKVECKSSLSLPITSDLVLDTTPLIKPSKTILPKVSSETLKVVFKLSSLFAIDAFASALAPVSWQTFFFKNKFNLSPTYLGEMFFSVGILAGFMSLLSTSLTKRLGPVVTMILTHLPASLILAILPFPSSQIVTVLLLMLRALMQSMDVTPKHVLLASMVPDSERTAVFGWVNVVKTLASMLGPSAAGFLTQDGRQWLTFVLSGSLKATYDVILMATFLAHNRSHRN